MTTEPDHSEMPERLPRGELTVTFEVAGLRVRLDGFPVAEEPFLPHHYPGYYSLGEGPADLAVACRVREEGTVLDPPPPGGEPTVTVETPTPDRVETRSHWHEGELDYGSGRGEVVLTSLGYIPFRMSLENFLRVAFANLLLREGGCLIHAAGVVRDGVAHVFFGLSEAGKSTVVELSQPHPALSDDLIAMRLGGGGLLAERVPFFGLYPATEKHGGRYRVVNLLSLAKDARHEVRTLPKSLQVLHLRTSLPFLNPVEPRALDFIERVLEVIPVRELAFRKDPGFWALLR